jgi:hypothetical protein
MKRFVWLFLIIALIFGIAGGAYKITVVDANYRPLAQASVSFVK